MFSNTKLPESVLGKWIWFSEESKSDRDFIIFKKDFPIYELAGNAELWIATHCFFHVFINGRAVTSGPIPHTGNDRSAFVLRVDVGHLLEVGTNHLVIFAHTENTALSGVRCTLKGLWMQLDVDDKAVVWTDEGWPACRTEQYRNTGLRTAPGDVFVEDVDMRPRLYDWLNLEEPQEGQEIYDGKCWRYVDYVKEPSPEYGSLEAFPNNSGTMELVLPKSVAAKGVLRQEFETSWVSFAQQIARNGKFGTYTAEAYIYSEGQRKMDAFCLCGEPYILFLNGRKIKEQAVPPVPLRNRNGGDDFVDIREQDLVEVDVAMHLNEGWNSIMLVQQCHSENSGATFIWPDISQGQLPVHARKAISAPVGWMLAGPMITPMALIYPDMPIDDRSKALFETEASQPSDISAYYLTCRFKPDDSATSETLPMYLANRQYVVVDFGSTHYSFPHLILQGHEGDIVDIVCGEIFRDGEVLSQEAGAHRNVSTLRLSEGENSWLAATQKGARYVMVVTRRIHDRIKLRTVALCQENVDHKNQGSFHCSSPVLENIWNAGVKTLETTMQRIYINSPTKDQAQSIPDAMIQSLAGYYVFGEYDKAAMAIEQFARAQMETGDLNAISPSGLFQTLPDYSLCWPVWLHKHFMHTGDVDFLKRMMPVLQRLMAFFNQLAIADNGPLGDMRSYFGVYAFIDYGEMSRKGISTALNAFYCRALMSASWLASQVEMPDWAETYKARASSVSKQVWQLTWNEEKGLFADSFHDGAPSSRFSWQSSLLAIYGGIAKPRHYDTIWNNLYCDDVPFESKVLSECNNPYSKYYELESAFALGKTEWGMDLMGYYWGGMLRAGATTWWELFDPARLPEQNARVCGRCQGYGVSPNIFLVSELVGIRPAEPGMKMVYFNPMPGDIVSWVKASIPTPHGYISVQWKMLDDGTFDININANYELEVVPVLAPGIARTAVFNVNEKVSILAEE